MVITVDPLLFSFDNGKGRSCAPASLWVRVPPSPRCAACPAAPCHGGKLFPLDNLQLLLPNFLLFFSPRSVSAH